VSTWDSSDLLAQWNRLCQRPTADEITDATKYQILTRGQEAVISEIEAIYPDCLYQAPAALSTSDNKVFTFGTDSNGYAVAPRGHVGIYPSLASVPDVPWQAGIDYLDEGTQIRIPYNSSYSGTLYWRGIPTPADITASAQPTLRPAPARRMIVLKAAMEFASEGGARADTYSAAEREWDKEFPKWMLNFRTRFRSGGVLPVYQYLGPDAVARGIVA
jgi:hypothetical protein